MVKYFTKEEWERLDWYDDNPIVGARNEAATGMTQIAVRIDPAKFQEVCVIDNDEDNIVRKQVDRTYEIFDELIALKTFMKDTIQELNEYTDRQLADLGFLMREQENYFDEMRKDAKALKEAIGKKLAAIVVQRGLSSGATDISKLTVQGLLATATPDASVVPKMPRKNTTEYRSLLTKLGVSEEAQKVVAPHYVRLSEWMTERLEQGLPVPEECRSTETKLSCVFKRKRGVMTTRDE